MPFIGPDVAGASYCPLDGHCNSLKLFRAFHTGLNRFGAAYLPNRRTSIHFLTGHSPVSATDILSLAVV